MGWWLCFDALLVEGYMHVAGVGFTCDFHSCCKHTLQAVAVTWHMVLASSTARFPFPKRLSCRCVYMGISLI